MIRDAEPDDADYFVEAARQYLLASGEGAYLSLDADAFRDQYLRIIDNESTVALIDHDLRGHILGIVLPSLWNPVERIARVNTIWVMPGHRGKGLCNSLLHAFERRLPQVQAILIDSSEALNPDSVGRLYELEGYTLKQKLYAKVRNGH